MLTSNVIVKFLANVAYCDNTRRKRQSDDNLVLIHVTRFEKKMTYLGRNDVVVSVKAKQVPV